MVKSKFTPEQKIQIVLESIRTSISTAELCRKHNVHPQTFHNWKQRFMESGKAGLSQSGKKDPIKTMKKREEDYKRLIGELTIANDILKKTWEERQRLSAVRELYEKMSLRKSLCYAGISRRMWYHKPKARNVGLDPATVQVVQRIGGKRPTYGTRRMAAQVCRETHTATNRKKIQRIFRKLGWIEPQKTKNDIIAPIACSSSRMHQTSYGRRT